MANVLNRTTLIYLKSVNTPDYPETDWVINPDLSAVDGVPTKYWVLETVMVNGPDILDYDPNTGDPIYVQVPQDTIRQMTVEEKQTYDAAHPAQPIFTGQLSDGTPAYQYRGHIISVNAQTVEFSAQVKGGKNFFLPCAQNGMLKFVCMKESLIKSVKVHGAPDSDWTIVFSNETRTIATINGNTTDVFVEDAFPVSAGEEIQCYLQSSSNFVDPQVELQIATR